MQYAYLIWSLLLLVPWLALFLSLGDLGFHWSSAYEHAAWRAYDRGGQRRK